MLTKNIFSIMVAGSFLSLSLGCSNPSSITQDSFENLNQVSMSSSFKNIDYKQIKVATYNVEKIKSPDALAVTIKDLNADVLALQEVDAKTSKTFFDKYLKDSGYQLVIPQQSGDSIDVVLLTKLPVIDTNPIVTKDAPPNITKNLFQVNLKANDNYSFIMLITNFKSNNSDLMEGIRTSIKAFEKSNRMYNYILAADLNNAPDAPFLQPMLDPRSSGLSFHDVVNEDLGSSAYSYIKGSKKSRVDYLMPSAGMFDEYLKNSVVIQNSTKTGDTSVFTKASSHLPIFSNFSVEKDLTVMGKK